jgi:hypothetical protein
MSSHIQDLDSVLEKVLLFSNERSHFFSSTDLKEKYKLNLDIVTIEAICRKLSDDGYIGRSFAKKEDVPQPSMPLYYMAYNGVMFHAQGGYREDVASKRRMRRFEIFRDWVIIAGAAGAVVLAIPYLWEGVITVMALLGWN